MITVLILALSMSSDRLIDDELARLIKCAYNAESADETSHHERRAAELLDQHPSRVPGFCDRFLVNFRDEWELSAAMSVSKRTKSRHPAIAEAAMSAIRDEKLEIVYRDSACSCLAKHGATMKLAVIEELLRRLPVKLRMSLSSDLITNLDRFDTEQRVDCLLYTSDAADE